MIDEYYISENGAQQGPFSLHQLIAENPELDTVIARRPSGPWKAAADIPELAGYFQAQGVAVVNEEDLADFWLRLGAFGIDLILLFFIIVIANIIYTTVTARQITPADVQQNRYLIQWIGTLVIVVYNAVFEATTLQGSVGKKLIGLHVVDQEGRRLRFSQSIVRNLGRILSNLIFYSGYLFIFFNPYRQALHDLMAKTYVIRKPYVAR